jgi:hypothetical protein
MKRLVSEVTGGYASVNVFTARLAGLVTDIGAARRRLIISREVFLTTVVSSASDTATPNYADRTTAACRRSYCQRLQIEGCRVVSATDPLRKYYRFPRPEPLLFLPSSSSVVLTRLSGARSRPTTSQKIW